MKNATLAMALFFSGVAAAGPCSTYTFGGDSKPESFEGVVTEVIYAGAAGTLELRFDTLKIGAAPQTCVKFAVTASSGSMSILVKQANMSMTLGYVLSGVITAKGEMSPTLGLRKP
jgi:hypothetical protein